MHLGGGRLHLIIDVLAVVLVLLLRGMLAVAMLMLAAALACIHYLVVAAAHTNGSARQHHR